MATGKYINLNYNLKSGKLKHRCPKGIYINDWEIEFKKGVSFKEKIKVLKSYLKSISENDYDDDNVVTAIEYAWYQWKDQEEKYRLLAYRQVTKITEKEKAARELKKQKSMKKITMKNSGANVTTLESDTEVAEGGPQPSGPMLPKPESVDSTLKMDLIPVTEPATEN